LVDRLHVGGIAWRFAGLGGATAGLALSPALPPGGEAAFAKPMLVLALLAGLCLSAARPRRGHAGQAAWIALVALAAAAAGLAVGAMRLMAIDRGAFHGPSGRVATVTGHVTAVPRRSNGEVRVRLQTGDGRIAIEAREPVPDLLIGREVRASGTLRESETWESGYLARFGIRQVLAADEVRLTGGRRGGPAGLIDRIRDRAEQALGAGARPEEAALLRGFVLGEDDRIDAATVDDFKRSGLAHLLAVSGENVMLLALLAVPLLALAGVPLRARLLCVMGLIAIYVPVTGAGPSIQRAGVMGAAGVAAALAGRPRSRWYAILLAAGATLAVNPRASGDPGWQLSFAAVVGIVLWAAPIRDLLVGQSAPSSEAGRDERRPLRWRRALAEGAAVTGAATVATAPLMAHHFEAVSIASVPANLLVLPAVAPLMWLGMLAAMAGQLPWLPVEPLTGLAGLLAAYVAQVAHWLGSPGWAREAISLPGPWGVLAAYALLALGLRTVLVWARRRRGLGRPAGRLKPLVAALGVAVVVVAPAGLPRPDLGPSERAAGLRVVVLDVGQGDAILLDPASGPPVLVDGGPPGDGLRQQLEDEGVSGLAAAVVTHDQSDHTGGIDELLGSFPVHRLLYAERGRDFLGAARAAGVRARSIAEGSEINSGRLRIDVLWPPRRLLEGDAAPDPNQAALVLLARWGGFRMLLTADAEAEAVPIDPGPVDVLKLPHHGSDDAGLGPLLARTFPSLAVISVGAGNPYGHPTLRTLGTLAEHHVPTVRTDQSGDVTISVTSEGWRFATDEG
jgi:competence protein ComEC